MPDVITDPSEVTVEWLDAVLRRNGHLLNADVAGVRELARKTLPGSAVLHLEVAYRGYTRLPDRLILRLSRRVEDLPGAREIEFYRLVAPVLVTTMLPAELPFLRPFDVAVSPEKGCAQVLLEDLWLTHATGDPVLPPTVLQSEGMIDSLASVHGWWWQHPRIGDDIGTRPTEEEMKDQLAAAQRNLMRWFDFMGDRILPARRASYERICAAWPPRRAQRMATCSGLTVVNGDAQPGNFFYPRFSGGRVRIGGWHAWHIGVGTDDLAFMMAALWYPERRIQLERLLLERYYRGLLEQQVRHYSWEDCWVDYLASIVALLFSLIASWEPGSAPALWYDRMERATLAFLELGCAHLLP